MTNSSARIPVSPPQRRVLSKRHRVVMMAWLMMIWVGGWCAGTLVDTSVGWTQGKTPPDDQSAQGYLIEVPRPLMTRDVEQILSQLTRLSLAVRQTASDAENASGRRVSVVLHFQQSSGERGGRAPNESGAEAGGSGRSTTSLEDALKLARAISGSDLKRIRPIAWVDAPVRGSDVLLVLACESILVSPTGSIGDATFGETPGDETTQLIYQSIAKRRSVLAPEIVSGLANSDLAIARVRVAEGPTRFAIGDDLEKLRREGMIVEETIWSEAGQPLILTADQLRELRAATAIVDSREDVADRLGLASLRSESVDASGEAVGVLLRINGPVRRDRVRRWQSNLAATIEAAETNTWLVEIDSPGGYLAGSASMAAFLADPGSSIRSVGGYVSREARGDATLLALACRPLMMHNDATLGGSGAEAIQPEDVRSQRELISLIAQATGRSETLMRGLLDRSLAVHRYSNRRTGRIRYAVPSEMAAEMQNGDADEASEWKREQRIELGEGLSAQAAIELGLVDEAVDSLKAVATNVGLTDVPRQLTDRGLVRWVERLGRNDGLAFGLLLLGFMMLSTEASAPGLGLPGFIAMLCFAFFFWTKFLAGTAEWAELLAFGLGLVCLAIEIFVLPGFGVFGIGGLVLTVLGVVLMSQTFVIPRNSYQVGELTQGVWMAIGGMGGLVIGFLIVRAFLPQAATATGLAMDAPSSDMDRLERIADYDHLAGQSGVASTRLRPSGKARFGDQIVAVVSDGSAIDPGQSVRVIAVHGNRIVVEAVEE
ncbi:membrane-bound ClpP family serine protease [Rhodopirellula rubra]|uniref:Membrane-bound ClpP family serine protease n=1 Tax=Aporhodopirellula rubra TaxID=980271 RepID=A0A7W5DW52_9BACT|nr:NfeD family protein [Aporhodopirellula rubra]MBB3205272.1 membrane-bound ClpP family serine protease [Aporhodopirellula rubra]